MRLHRSLNGQWQFQLDPNGLLTVETLSPDRQIPVPMPWQAAFPELEQYGGFGWYRTTIAVDEGWLGGHLLLTFGAVDYWSQVFVNGQLVCEHEGGYTPFTAHIESHVHTGDNDLVVRVYDAPQDSIIHPRWPDSGPLPAEPTKPPFEPRNIPHGKQEWYISASGIWQDVTLTAVSKIFVEQAHLTTNIRSGEVEVQVTLHGDIASGSLRVAVDGTSREASVPLVAGQTAYTVKLRVDKPQWWTPETPKLYTASVSVTSADGKAADDTLKVRFGFREITTANGHMLLNGAPLFLRSALDQDLYDETIYTVPSEAYLRDEFQKAKELGLNCLRCHIKVPDPLYLDLADEMGLLIWTEIPSWRTFPVKMTIHKQFFELGAEIKARASQTLEEMIRRDFNHPSIIAWTIVNEDWGTMLALSADDRKWIVEMYDLCKRIDPTRLVVDNSACGNSWGPNIHVKSDLEDYHVYTNIPDQADHWVEMLEQFDLHPLWTYSSHGDAQRTGREPLILSEFGNWGLPKLSGLRSKTGGDPAWFTLGPWWSTFDGESGWPRGVQDRFRALGLDKIFADYDSFAEATQWHQFRAFRFEIETMRRLSHISGYVITELSDIYWESNGLLDFKRGKKVYHDKFASINAADVIAPQLDRYAYWDDQSVVIRLYGSHYSAADWSGGMLGWTFGEQHGGESVGSVAPGVVEDFGVKQIALSPVDKAQSVEIVLSLQGASGAELAHNTVEVLVLPTSFRRAAYDGQISVITPRRPLAPSHTGPSKLESSLSGMGYTTTGRLSGDTKIAITDKPDARVLDWVRSGGDLLYLCEQTSPLFWRQWRGGPYSGSWMTSFSWLRPGVYKRLGTVANPLSLPFRNVMPSGVILGLPVENAAIHQDLLGGQITGWVNHPAIHTVQFRLGKGRVMMTTLSLKDQLEQDQPDPVAVVMLHDLVDQLVVCQPTLTTNY